MLLLFFAASVTVALGGMNYSPAVRVMPAGPLHLFREYRVDFALMRQILNFKNLVLNNLQECILYTFVVKALNCPS